LLAAALCSERRVLAMALHGAKRTRSAEEVPTEDIYDLLERDLWPSLREHCAAVLRERVDAEVACAREAMETEFAARWAALVEREATVEAALRKAEEARTGFEAERDSLQWEKERMAAGKHMEDILNLNIGGEKIVSVQRKTLCQVEDSMLAVSFSGRWDDSLVRDKDGAIFVDFRPELFMPLLDFLRAKRVQDPTTPVLMPTVREAEEAFQTMLKYYGLESAGQSPPSPLAFTFLPPTEGRTFEIRDGGLAATRSTGFHWKRVFGSAIVSRTTLPGPVTMQFRIGAMGKDRFEPAGPNIGVAVATLDRSSDDSNVRRPQGVWSYRPADGALLAPTEADIVGLNSRVPAGVGDVLSLTLYKDGTMGLAKNKEDQGVIFCNLPDSVKPVVEMNIRYTQVSIVP